LFWGCNADGGGGCTIAGGATRRKPKSKTKTRRLRTRRAKTRV
jgi:hypothetical protein